MDCDFWMVCEFAGRDVEMISVQETVKWGLL